MDIAYAALLVSGWGGGILGWVQFWRKIRENRAQQQRTDKLQKELDERDARAKGPRFSALHLLIPERPNGYEGGTHFTRGELVPATVQDGTLLQLYLMNQGVTVFEVTDDLADGEGFTNMAGTIDPIKIQSRLNYKFSREKHGKPQIATIHFVDLEGAQRYQKYEYVHGKTEIKRVWPP